MATGDAAAALERFVRAQQPDFERALAELRAGLRERLQQSILMDEPAFARDFAATLRRCWQEWCASRH